MGFLRGQGTQETIYSGLQVQSTSGALPIPIMWGITTGTVMCIWYDDFTSQSKRKGGAAKFLSGGSNQKTYFCSIILGICEGPINSIRKAWQTSSVETSLAELGLSLLVGSSGETPWGFLVSNHPSAALAYRGLAKVYAQKFALGASASVGSITLEVVANLSGSGFNGIDANPAQVISDFLTNSQYGVGFPSGSIDATALSAYSDYCWAAGLAFSPNLSSQESAATILDRWLKITNSTAIWTGALLRILPLADQSISGNGVNWTYDATPLYDLTDEDFLGDSGSDPIEITRVDPWSIPNRLSIEMKDRNGAYQTRPIDAFDQSMIDRFGLRIGSSETMHEVCDVQVGQRAAQLLLQRQLYIRRVFKFRLGWEFCLLDPMDIVTLTDPPLGLYQHVVRIREIEEDDSGALSLIAEEFPGTSGTAPIYTVQPTSNGLPTGNPSIASVNPPIIFEPPGALTNNIVQIWMAVSPVAADPQWAGAYVWLSADGVSFGSAPIGAISGATPMGWLTASLPAIVGGNPDVTHTLSVDISESGQSLASTTSGNAYVGATLCFVNNELLAYATATLTGAGRYDLTELYRGYYGTTAALAANGAQFAFLTGNLFQYTIPAFWAGSTFYFKLQSFDVLGAVQDLATCASYVWTAGSVVKGPVVTALLLGTAQDYGAVSGSVVESDDFGPVSGPAYYAINLGTVP